MTATEVAELERIRRDLDNLVDLRYQGGMTRGDEVQYRRLAYRERQLLGR